MYFCSKSEDYTPFGNVGTELHASCVTYQPTDEV